MKNLLGRGNGCTWFRLCHGSLVRREFCSKSKETTTTPFVGPRKYFPAEGTPAVPAWKDNEVQGRLFDREKDVGRFCTSSFSNILRFTGVVKTDINSTTYWVKPNYYRPLDYVPFERDPEDRLPIPYYWQDDAVEICLRSFMDYFLFYRFESESGRKKLYRSQKEGCLITLRTVYGVKVDLQAKRWNVLPKCKLLPLQFPVLRKELASALCNYLEANNFSRVYENTMTETIAKCRIFTRPLDNSDLAEYFESGRVELRIRSSIEIDKKSTVTESGGQAIQVYLAYVRNDDWPYERIVYRASRILRVGHPSEIMKRLTRRILEAEENAKDELKRCTVCSIAPLFRSKKRNWVCAHFCFAKDPQELKKVEKKSLPSNF